MKKFALLIGSPLTQDHKRYIPEVSIDIKRYMDYLMSSAGGGWKREEIAWLPNPSSRTLKFWLNRCIGKDLVQIVFSGHGDAEYIQINNHEFLHINSLLSIRCNRQIVILDSCRKFRKYNPLEGLGYGDFFTRNFGLDYTDIQTARDLYNHYIENSKFGKILITACAEDEYSYSTPNIGGHYSLSLLKALMNWYESGQGMILTASDAFDYSITILDQDYGDTNYFQNPEGYVWEDGLYIPIAVNPRVYRKHYGT